MCHQICRLCCRAIPSLSHTFFNGLFDALATNDDQKDMKDVEKHALAADQVSYPLSLDFKGKWFR